jgi:hypothetical protein
VNAPTVEIINVTPELAGEPHPSHAASVARRVMIYNQLGGKDLRTSGITTHHEILVTLEAFPDIREAVIAASKKARNAFLSPATFGFVWWVLFRADDDHADEFFEGLTTGADLSRGHPILLLRDKLSEARASVSRTPERTLAAYVFKAWNASRKGQSMGLLRFTSTEAFPIPVGKSRGFGRQKSA